MTDTSDQSIDEFLGVEQQPRWRRYAKFWVPAVLLLVVALAIAKCSGTTAKEEYVSEAVTRKALDIQVTATGNLRPTNQVEVGSEVSGKIDKIYVDVNDRVTRGQVIAQINTDVIDDQITQAQANLKSAQASVAQAQATLNYDQAQLARFQEVSRLSGGKVPSQSEMQNAEAAVARDNAQLASAQANVQSSRASLSTSLTQRSRAIIRSPVSGVVLARQVEPGQTVAASFNTPTLFVIAEDLAQMQLRVAIDEADVGQVKAGQAATFTVDAYPGKQFPATVERIDLGSDNTVSSASSSASTASSGGVVSYEARLTVANPAGLLRPGMTATASIKTVNTGVQMLVPNGALRFRPGASVKRSGGGGGVQIRAGLERGDEQATIGPGSKQKVYVQQADGKLKDYDVVTGLSDGKLTVVTSKDLKPGMKVITGVKSKAAQ